MGLSSSKAAAGRRLRQAAGRAESNYTTYEDDIYKCDEASLYGPSNQTTLDGCRAEAELYAGEVAAYQFFVGQTAPECYLYTPSCFSGGRPTNDKGSPAPVRRRPSRAPVNLVSLAALAAERPRPITRRPGS